MKRWINVNSDNGRGTGMKKTKVDRINELARKSRAEGLTEAEAAEQADLRAEYIAEVRANLRGQLDSTVIVRPDGTREKVSERRTEKS